jgi:hypothetical protein
MNEPIQPFFFLAGDATRTLILGDEKRAGHCITGARKQATKDGEKSAIWIGDGADEFSIWIGDGPIGHPAQASDEAFCYLKDPGDYDAMLEIGEACKHAPFDTVYVAIGPKSDAADWPFPGKVKVIRVANDEEAMIVFTSIVTMWHGDGAYEVFYEAKKDFYAELKKLGIPDKMMTRVWRSSISMPF